MEHYRDQVSGECTRCEPPCNTALGFYESAPCTETSNRECALCFGANSCNPVGEYFDDAQGCPGVLDPWRPCAPCTNKPANNSLYVSPVEIRSNDAFETMKECTWTCEDGYYARAADSDVQECVRCTNMTSANCGPGFMLAPCSSYFNVDASCSQPCSAADSSDKPDDNDETSEWVWTTYKGTSGEMVYNPTGGLDGLPNVGCMWRCKTGYTLRTVDAGGGPLLRVSFCTKETI